MGWIFILAIVAWFAFSNPKSDVAGWFPARRKRFSTAIPSPGITMSVPIVDDIQA